MRGHTHPSLDFSPPYVGGWVDGGGHNCVSKGVEGRGYKSLERARYLRQGLSHHR